MNAFSRSAFATRIGARTWTCSTCRGHLARTDSGPSGLHEPSRTGSGSPWGARRFASAGKVPGTRDSRTGGNGNGNGRRGTGRILFASTGAALTGTVLAFTDDIKEGYETAERTGRVAVGLGVCINDYRTTLNAMAAIEDPVERERMLKACHRRCSERTLKVLEKNGGIFIKLGQHLSAMNYLLPSEWTTTFIPLQDKCPVSSFESIEDMFRKDTGGELWDFFSEFSEQPIGAASLAQVHLATIKETGRRVAVKVQHPELETWAPLDLALTKFTFSAVKRFFPEYDLEWLSSEMEVSLPKELDFEEEAENARRMMAHFARIPELPLVVPEVIWAKKRILVMANESGRRPDDLAYLDEHGIDRDEVSATLARIFNEMIFGDGAPLHCDPHGGNLAVRANRGRRSLGRGPNFDIILYDHGLHRDIPTALRRSYAKMWLAVIDGDMDRMRTYAREVAGIGDDDFPLFASAITGRDFSVVSRQGSILETRTAAEQSSMSGALQDGLIVDLVQMLGRVPRIILLILKTNDLTRSLDESLQTRQGPIRSFMILARYCTRTVFYERLEEIGRRGSLLWPPNALRVFAAWLGLARVELKLEAFELWLGVKRMLGLQGLHFGGRPLAP
ncbi:ABC1 family protein [Escovopsis weberi]|uniref:ABC1 family protein n=1 Tax=Escovopsis weberi TaxID=150374 RepID=A0A0M8N486_ESCWE|nr:ABC1 family protein [Escovopsis weberi]